MQGLLLELLYSCTYPPNSSQSPVVVMLSESMEPAFQRGDILFLNNQDDPIRAGDVVVFKIKDRGIPIVHRCLKYMLIGIMGVFEESQS